MQNILPTILKELGIPNDRKDLKVKDIIESVLKKNHPNVPEYSDISNQKLDSKDGPNKITAILLEETEFPTFYSNILLVADSEKESISKCLFRKITLKKQDEVVKTTKIIATFVVPKDCKILTRNKKAFENVGLATLTEGVSDACLSILLQLIRTSKGIVSVSIERDDNETETLSVFDLSRLIQNN